MRSPADFYRVMPHVPGANAMPMAVTRVTGTKGARTRTGQSLPMRPSSGARPFAGQPDIYAGKGARQPRKRRNKVHRNPQPSAVSLYAAWARGHEVI